MMTIKYFVTRSLLPLLSLSLVGTANLRCRRQVLAEKTAPTLSYPPLPIHGQVIDLDGHPVADARILTAEGEVKTAADGRFETVTGRGNRWVTALHPSYVSRTRAGSPGEPLLLRLTPNPDGDVVSLLFGGDTMFGRRFFDFNGDGNTGDALIKSDQFLASETALLAGIKPLLENADLTFVNLETPLTSDYPYYAPTAERPLQFHESKQFAFASHSSAAEVLRQVGVDIIGLSNNHLYDLKENGVTQTIASLKEWGYQSGFNLFGAGKSEDDAWQEALFTAHSKTAAARATPQKIAFLGCTTITGEEHTLSYVAGPDKGGAAACDIERIKSQVTRARDAAEAVIFMVHGGFEYEREATPNVKAYTQAAVDAGATLVINHHPHVVGGLRWNPLPAAGSTAVPSLIAWSMGNLLFDQNIWQTFESYALVVHLKKGKIIQAYTEPLMLESYVPHGVTGELARYVATGAAGRDSPHAFVVENGSAVLDVGSRAAVHEKKISLSDEGEAQGRIIAIDQGAAAAFAPEGPSSRLRLGRDLLWSGSFEDEILDLPPQTGPLWLLRGFDKEVAPTHSFRGSQGAGLWREPSDDRDVVLTPQHRVLIKPGTDISLIGMARSRHSFTIQISWYPDAKGSSTLQTLVVNPIATDDAWHPFRIDATVPLLPAPPPPVVKEPIIESERIKPSIGIFLRLPPSDQGKRTAVDIDDVRLIEWAPEAAAMSPLYNFMRIEGRGTVTLEERVLPGGESWAAPWVLTPEYP